MWPCLGQQLQGQFSLPCCPLLSVGSGEDAMTAQSGCLPPLCSAGGEGCASCTSPHSQPSSLLFWHVCVPHGVLVAWSPKWAGWWREALQEGSTDSSLTDTAWAWWLLNLVWCDAFNPALVSYLTMVPSHGPCWIWILLWGWRVQIPLHHWRLKYHSLNLVLPEILSNKWWFYYFSTFLPSQKRPLNPGP